MLSIWGGAESREDVIRRLSALGFESAELWRVLSPVLCVKSHDYCSKSPNPIDAEYSRLRPMGKSLEFLV